jgi:hypothetical protein
MAMFRVWVTLCQYCSWGLDILRLFPTNCGLISETLTIVFRLLLFRVQEPKCVVFPTCHVLSVLSASLEVVTWLYHLPFDPVT